MADSDRAQQLLDLAKSVGRQIGNNTRISESLKEETGAASAKPPVVNPEVPARPR